MNPFIKKVAFGAILGITLGILGFGVQTWQFWLGCIVLSVAHQTFPASTVKP